MAATGNRNACRDFPGKDVFSYSVGSQFKFYSQIAAPPTLQLWVDQ
jgi:hypothetical protein